MIILIIQIFLYEMRLGCSNYSPERCSFSDFVFEDLHIVTVL